MSGIEVDPIFKYWGKADDQYVAEPKWHPLVYHCMDVACLLYTSDAADERSSVDLGGRRIIKQKKKIKKKKEEDDETATQEDAWRV